ncbi:hypothetical protein QOT17_004308 [Balamuthia mandrillaris]
MSFRGKKSKGEVKQVQNPLLPILEKEEERRRRKQERKQRRIDMLKKKYSRSDSVKFNPTEITTPCLHPSPNTARKNPTSSEHDKNNNNNSRKSEQERKEEIRKWLAEDLQLPQPEELCQLLVDDGFDDMETITLMEEDDLQDMGWVDAAQTGKIMDWVRRHRPAHYRSK